MAAGMGHVVAGRMRFDDAALGRVACRMKQRADLSERILALCADLRTVHPVRPPHVEYELTRLGRSLLKPINQFLNWTLKAFPDIQRAREVFDKSATRSPQQ